MPRCGGLLVGFLLLFGSSPALSLATAGEAIRYAQHGNSDLADTEGGGHALGSGEIAPEEEAGEGGQCTRAAGPAGALGYYACRARDARLRLGRARHRHLHRAARALDALAVGLYEARRPTPRGSPPSIFPRSSGPISSADRRISFSCTIRPACGSPCKITEGRRPSSADGWSSSLPKSRTGGSPLTTSRSGPPPTRSLSPTSCFPRRSSSDRKSPRPFFIVGYITL